jgi:hypothetical protein
MDGDPKKISVVSDSEKRGEKLGPTTHYLQHHMTCRNESV